MEASGKASDRICDPSPSWRHWGCSRSRCQSNRAGGSPSCPPGSPAALVPCTQTLPSSPWRGEPAGAESAHEPPPPLPHGLLGTAGPQPRRRNAGREPFLPREERGHKESSESLLHAPGALSPAEGTGRTHRSPLLTQHPPALTVSGRLIPALSLFKGGITRGDFHPYNQEPLGPAGSPSPGAGRPPQLGHAAGTHCPSCPGPGPGPFPPPPPSHFGAAIPGPKRHQTKG